MAATFTEEISHLVWRYKYRAETESDIRDSWARVARTLAAATDNPADSTDRFLAILDDFHFLPGGRIVAGAGTPAHRTLFNCFVMGEIEDSIEGIFAALREGALTMQLGGGVGYDFSTLRPAGTASHTTGNLASGPVSFMQIWDKVCEVLISTSARRGAMMATLRADHPDILQFVDAKREGGLTNFNLSVLVCDEFMQRVYEDEAWPLLFPLLGDEESGDEPRSGEVVYRTLPGSASPVACRVYRWIGARELWQRILRACYEYAEPGVLFIDRINRENNLHYCERISATNPCGEIPLPPYGACNLGSINLPKFVRAPFTAEARLDTDAIADTAAVAVEMLNAVIDTSQFPLPQQARCARSNRRIGLGITGLADTLFMLGLHYASKEAHTLAADTLRVIRDSAYRSSVALAQKQGPFPQFDADAYLASSFISRLPEAIRRSIAEHGIRNSHLLAIAPAGSISLLAGNVSSGLEPIFGADHKRFLKSPDGVLREYQVEDFACAQWRRQQPGRPFPDSYVTAHALSPQDHLLMQAALQPYVDNAISKTINVPVDMGFADFVDLYERAWELGLKGCTAFRNNPVTGAVLESSAAEASCQVCGCP